jgi:hypothetical protein
MDYDTRAVEGLISAVMRLLGLRFHHLVIIILSTDVIGTLGSHSYVRTLDSNCILGSFMYKGKRKFLFLSTTS